jgi:spermidine synthase
MKNWDLLGEAAIPGSNEILRLFQGKDDFFIKITSVSGELMSTRKYGSEEALGTLPCQKLTNPDNAKVLIGGLGMGFTHR